MEEKYVKMPKYRMFGKKKPVGGTGTKGVVPVP